MDRVRAHLLIGGRVQGVFYRAFTRDVAHELGLNGWVRNLYDGRVEALFEGDKEKVNEAVRRCRSGPPGAHVEVVDIEWEECRGDEKGFHVRYY